ncbi:MAG: riboflavin synthase [Burkholderiales bacterium]
MFTGIIQALGRVRQITMAGQSASMSIDAGDLDLADVRVGDSIACNGVCLTVKRLDRGGFLVDVSQETLNVTAGFVLSAAVNLEKALRLSDRLGGHLVSGHVDGVGEVTSFVPVDANRELKIRFPKTLARYFAQKGSATVNGVSLTLNSVCADEFSVNLIPHTLAVTNLHDLKSGDRVNLEVDLVARYVANMLDTRGSP